MRERERDEGEEEEEREREGEDGWNRGGREGDASSLLFGFIT